MKKLILLFVAFAVALAAAPTTPINNANIQLNGVPQTGVLAGNTTGAAAATQAQISAALDLIGGTRGQVLYRGASAWTVLAPGTAGYFLRTGGAGADPSWAAESGTGTVTSVGLALPDIFTVSGSPVTTTGTLTGTLANQNANLVWAGPASGPAAPPTFRALVASDLPSSAYVSSVAGTAGNVLVNGGTSAQTGAVTLSLPTALTSINSITSATGQALTLATPDSNANIVLSPHGTGLVDIPYSAGHSPELRIQGNAAGTVMPTLRVNLDDQADAFVNLQLQNITGNGGRFVMKNTAGKRYDIGFSTTALSTNSFGIANQSTSGYLAFEIDASEALYLRAGGTNQSVAIVPSGTGIVTVDGVGTITASGTSGTGNFIRTAAYSAGAGSGISLFSNDGTNQPTSGARMGNVSFGGRDSGGNAARAMIAGFATETWVSGSANGMSLQFQTTANGTATRSTKMTLAGDGAVTLVGTAFSVPAGWTVTSAGAINLTAGGSAQDIVMDFNTTGALQVPRIKAGSTTALTLTGGTAGASLSLGGNASNTGATLTMNGNGTFAITGTTQSSASFFGAGSLGNVNHFGFRALSDGNFYLRSYQAIFGGGTAGVTIDTLNDAVNTGAPLGLRGSLLNILATGTTVTLGSSNATSLIISGGASATLTGGAGNMTIIAGTGSNRSMTFQTVTSGGATTTALTLAADQTATFALDANFSRASPGPAIAATASNMRFRSFGSYDFVVNTGGTGFSAGGVGTTGRWALGGSNSQSAWGTAGAIISVGTAATITDSSTAGSGTATNAVFTSFSSVTLAATNSLVTTTDAATVYIAGAPTAGTNMTISNGWAFWIAAGRGRFDGGLSTGRTTANAQIASGVSSSTVPVHTFWNDSDSGLGGNGSGSIYLTTDGVAAVTVNSSQNVSLANNLTLAGTALITKPGGTIPLITTNTAITDGAGALTATFTNSPVTGNPTKWVRIDDNGTIRYIPAF